VSAAIEGSFRSSSTITLNSSANCCPGKRSLNTLPPSIGASMRIYASISFSRSAVLLLRRSHFARRSRYPCCFIHGHYPASALLRGWLDPFRRGECHPGYVSGINVEVNRLGTAAFVWGLKPTFCDSDRSFWRGMDQ
jgi:hypothetical protein